MEISKELYQEIKAYCKANGIKNLKEQVDTCLRYGFNVLKYGDNPFTYHNPMDDMPKAYDINIHRDMFIKSVNLEYKEGKIVITYYDCDGNVNDVDVSLSSLIDTHQSENTDILSGISDGRVDEKIENQLDSNEQPSSESEEREKPMDDAFKGDQPKGSESEKEESNKAIEVKSDAPSTSVLTVKPKRKVKIIRRNKSNDE